MDDSGEARVPEEREGRPEAAPPELLHADAGGADAPTLTAPPRSRDLELAAREADRHTRRAFELAGRRAHFAARAEFVVALRLLAQALDAESHTDRHSGALAAGLAALEEADDFLPGGSRLEAQLDLPAIIASHRTPVFQGVSVQKLTPLEAFGTYLSFAQEQLGTAAGNEVAGSMALRGLGKLHAALADDRTAAIRGAQAKAMVFFQSALLVEPENYMAANDLGVLLARGGRYEDARQALEHRLAIRQDATGWHNLAMVYRELGLVDRSERATRLAERARSAQPGPAAVQTPAGSIRWLDPAAFARGGVVPPGARPAAQPVVPSRQAGLTSGSPQAGGLKRVAESSTWNLFEPRK